MTMNYNRDNTYLRIKTLAKRHGGGHRHAHDGVLLQYYQTNWTEYGQIDQNSPKKCQILITNLEFFRRGTN